jgi:SAM-dependent methyltransferase
VDEFDALVADAEAAPINGWDFSWLDGRATEERPPWGYARMVAARVPDVGALLDVETGGGEMLASVAPLPALTVATEPWPPNVPVAARRLRPLGAHVVAADGLDLPLLAETFDLVISRHPRATAWPTVARVLRSGGTFLSQQIGADNVEELGAAIRGPRPPHSPGPRRGPDRERADAQAHGLEVVDVREANLRCVFHDIAAVVYFLRLVVWIVPDFSVDRYRTQLRALHERIRTDGPFVATSTRFLIEARKPRTATAERRTTS